MKDFIVASKTDLIVSHRGETLSVRVCFVLNPASGTTTSSCETIVNAGLPGEKVVETGDYKKCFHYCDAMADAEERLVASMETHEHLEQ